jgi:hypothetical protein
MNTTCSQVLETVLKFQIAFWALRPTSTKKHWSYYLLGQFKFLKGLISLDDDTFFPALIKRFYTSNLILHIPSSPTQILSVENSYNSEDKWHAIISANCKHLVYHLSLNILSWLEQRLSKIGFSIYHIFQQPKFDLLCTSEKGSSDSFSLFLSAQAQRNYMQHHCVLDHQNSEQYYLGCCFIH